MHKKSIADAGFIWEDGWLREKGRKICNFCPEVLECYEDSKTGELIYDVQMHIGKGVVKRLCIRASQLEKMDYMGISGKCVCGIKTSVNEIRKIMQYLIKEQANELPNTGVFLEDIGWSEVDGKGMVYCAGSKLIAKGELQNVKVDEQLQNRFRIMDMEQVQAEKIFAVCRKFLSMKCPIVTILILTSVLACLKSMFIKMGAVPHFVIYIYGSTGTYKTTMAKYFCRLYGGKNDMGGLFGELESTNPALEETIGKARDVCVVIDDIAPCQKNKNTKDKKEKAASLIRRASSATPLHKCRGSKTLSINYDGVLVFTAEELLETVSIMNRTILVSTDSYKIDKKILKMMGENPDFSVLFQQCIIRWAAREQESVMREIKESFEKSRSRDDASSKDMSMNRVKESFDILHIAWKILQMCGADYECELSGEDKAVRKAVVNAMDNEWSVIKRMEMQKKCDNLGGLLYQDITTGEIAIAKNKKEFEEKEPLQIFGSVSGLRHKGKLYLMDGKVIDYMNQKYRLALTKYEFRKRLEREGLLVKDESGAKTKKLDGMRFLVLDYEGLKELYE